MKYCLLAKEITLILLLFSTTVIASAQSWEFNTPNDSEGWAAYNAGAVNENTNVQNDGLYIIDPVGPDPIIEINRLTIGTSILNNS